MAEVIPFARADNVTRISGLSDDECATLLELGVGLIRDGWATGLRQGYDQDGGRYVMLTGLDDAPLIVTRHLGHCVLLDEDGTPLASSRRLHVVVDALMEVL